MRRILLIFIIILTLSIYIKVDASENEFVPEDAFEFNNHSYKLFDSGCTQKQAIEICENLGGHLLTITSEEEQTFINSMIEDCTMKNIWLGGSYVNNEWYWITDEKFTYVNWNDGEPNNVFNSQNAIMMYTYHGADNDNNTIEIGKWNDENENGRNWDGYTSEETGFICEWDFLSTHNSINDQEPQSVNNGEKQKVSNDISSPIPNIESNPIEDANIKSGSSIESKSNNDGVNITFHIDNLSIIGGISIFGGISFVGVIIKNKKRKKNRRNDSTYTQ